MNAAVRKWVPALAPALLVLLLGVQVFLGARGFDHPHPGILGALELPGRLLGWGGVALLLPLLAWLLLGWWGFNVTGMALKTLGALTLGLAVGGLSSLWGGPAAGGLIGGPLGGLLGDVVGGFLGTVLLLLMVVPGTLLASARFQLGPRSAGAAAGATPGATKAPKSAPSLRAPPRVPVAPVAKGWYPAKRYDAEGNELPMEFGGASDVGSIRYRDAAESAPARPAAPASPPEPRGNESSGDGEAPTDRAASERTASGWPQGLVAAPDEGAEPARPSGTARATPPEPQDAPGVRQHVGGRAAPETRPASVTPRAPTSEAPGQPTKVFARQLFPKNPGDAVLLPGVRYRDDVAAEPAAPPPVSAPTAPSAAPPAPAAAPPKAQASAPTASRAPAAEPAARPARPRKTSAPKPDAKPASAPAPAATAPPPNAAAPKRPKQPTPIEASPLGPPVVPYVRTADGPTEEETVSRALEPLGDMAAMARYRSKLEASGIFGGAPAAAPAPPPAAPSATEGPTRASSAATAPKPATVGPASAPADAARKDEKRPAKAPVPEKPRPTAPPPSPKDEKPRDEKPKDEKPRDERPGRAAKPERTKGAKPTPIAETGSLFDTDAEEPPPAKPAAAAKSSAAKPRGAWVEELKDAAFLQAVEAAVERGAASPVLLTRRMGLGYARAQALVERLAQAGVLGEVAANGARPVLIRAEDLEAARPPRA